MTRAEVTTPGPGDEVLEVGAGQSPDPRATVTVDVREDLDHIDHPGVDIGEDPWPVEDRAFGLVIANQVLEHVPPERLTHVFHEVDRVLKSGGRFHVRIPHPGTWRAVTDPTHFGSGGWTPDVTRYFTGELEEYWPELDWEVEAWTTVEFPLFVRPGWRLSRAIRSGSLSVELMKVPFVGGETEFVARIP